MSAAEAYDFLFGAHDKKRNSTQSVYLPNFYRFFYSSDEHLVLRQNITGYFVKQRLYNIMYACEWCDIHVVVV